MITVPVLQAFFIGLLRLAAMGAGVWLYTHAHGDAATLAFAGGFAFFAMTGQAIDVLHVARQVASAQTTTSVTVQQPVGTPTPVQLTAQAEQVSAPLAQPKGP